MAIIACSGHNNHHVGMKSCGTNRGTAASIEEFSLGNYADRRTVLEEGGGRPGDIPA
jgi:hypothetical protein